MSSATGPDLGTATEKIEELMDDACIVTFDAEGARDDVLNRVTAVLEPPAGDASVIYNKDTQGEDGRSLADADDLGGKCKIKPASQSSIAQLVTEGGAQQIAEFYDVGLPIDSPLLPNGADLVIVSSRRDPENVGNLYRVRRPSFGTFTVQRKYLVELRP